MLELRVIQGNDKTISSETFPLAAKVRQHSSKNDMNAIICYNKKFPGEGDTPYISKWKCKYRTIENKCYTNFMTPN